MYPTGVRSDRHLWSVDKNKSRQEHGLEQDVVRLVSSTRAVTRLSRTPLRTSSRNEITLIHVNPSIPKYKIIWVMNSKIVLTLKIDFSSSSSPQNSCLKYQGACDLFILSKFDLFIKIATSDCIV